MFPGIENRPRAFPLAQTVVPCIGGLGLSNDGTTPATVIDIAAGMCSSDDLAALISLGAFTKTTGAWAAGSGNGGLDTGSIAASAWYHFYAILNPGSRAADVVFTATAPSSGGPAMPAGFTKKRRIGVWKTDGSSHWVTMKQYGQASRREYLLGTPVRDQNGLSIGTGPTAVTLANVPPGLAVEAIINGVQVGPTTVGVTTTFYPGDITSAPPDNNLGGRASTGASPAGFFILRTNLTQQINAASSSASAAVNVTTLGFYDDL